MNRPLQPPDSLHLEAAHGWLELGNPIEADVELDKITPQLRSHPDVLKVRWEVYVEARKWDAALDIASATIQLAPDDPLGWVNRSYVLHELKRLASWQPPAEAWAARWSSDRRPPASSGRRRRGRPRRTGPASRAGDAWTRLR